MQNAGLAVDASTLVTITSFTDNFSTQGICALLALMADAVGTSVGAVLGTSTVTTFVESASGITAGGRTGLTSLVAGFLFLLSTLFAPLFTAIPSFATAPALIMVGFLMVSSVTEIRFDDDN